MKYQILIEHPKHTEHKDIQEDSRMRMALVTWIRPLCDAKAVALHVRGDNIVWELATTLPESDEEKLTDLCGQFIDQYDLQWNITVKSL